MSGDDLIVCRGVVLEAGRAGHFVVEADLAGMRRKVLAKLSGKMRQAWVRVVPGDDVELEFSGYSLDRARISFRGVRQHPRGAT